MCRRSSLRQGAAGRRRRPISTNVTSTDSETHDEPRYTLGTRNRIRGTRGQWRPRVAGRLAGLHRNRSRKPPSCKRGKNAPLPRGRTRCCIDATLAVWCPAGGLRHSAIGSERRFAHGAPSQPNARGVAAERPRRAETVRGRTTRLARNRLATGSQPARLARWTRTGQVSAGLVAPLGAQTSWSVKPQRPRWVASGGRDETQAPAYMREYLTSSSASSEAPTSLGSGASCCFGIYPSASRCHCFQI
jgi:hypothetical protein